MANIELVIKIDKEYVKQIDRLRFSSDRIEDRSLQINVINAIKNGTPLPKGHGKLKDENEIIECIRNRVENLKNDSQFIKYRKDIDLLGTIPHIRNEVRTIIEADRE